MPLLRGSPEQQETLKASGPGSDTGMVAPGSGNKQHHRAALSSAPERFESSAQIGRRVTNSVTV